MAPPRQGTAIAKLGKCAKPAHTGRQSRMLALLTALLLACMMLAPGYAGKVSATCGVEA